MRFGNFGNPAKYLLGLALAGSCLVIFADPALAEVCDKVRPQWSPSEGPVGQLHETIYVLDDLFSSWLGWMVLVAVALAVILRRLWLNLFAALLLGLLVALLFLEWWEGDPVYLAALAEGCMAPPILSAAVLGGLSLFMTWRGLKTKLGRTPAPR